LADDLGNLLNRTITMIHRYRGGVVPAPAGVPEPNDTGRVLEAAASELGSRLRAALEAFDPQAALGVVWAVVGEANRYVESTAPWRLAQAERAGDAAAKAGLDTVLYSLAETLRLVAEALRPFLPETAERAAQQLGVALAAARWLQALEWGKLPAGTSVAAPRPLFPKAK
jgi:methionyl-tRNA synthetase